MSKWNNFRRLTKISTRITQRDQLVSGDIREKDGMSWEEYQESAQVSGALFEGIDGQIYYLLEG